MTDKAGKETIDERAQHLLRVLVKRYIREGQPVGSRTLSRDSGLELSPATVRNIMADLEDLGYVDSPHTSAGRVPTVKAYRFFVDTLVKLSPPKGDELVRFQQSLAQAAGNPQAVALSASNALSSVTQLAGVVTVPRRAQAELRQLEFIPLPGQRVLAILVVNDTEVQNKILELERSFTEAELRQAANYLTSLLSGRDLYQVRDQLLAEMRQTRESMNEMMVNAIQLAQEVLPDSEPTAEYVVAGETNLFGIDSLVEMDQLKGLFEAFSQRSDFLHLLDQTMRSDGVKIFIGHESGHKLLDSWSIVSAPYTAEDETVGVLGVIGPTRMAYERVIPVVDITAKLVGRVLNSRG